MRWSEFNNIYVLGFSFTGYGDQTSFGKLLEAGLKQDGWRGSVNEISYGGLSVDGVAALTAKTLTAAKKSDLVLLELATSFFSLQKYSFEDALPYVQHIVNTIAHLNGSYLSFINLFRSDIDDEDCVVQAIRACSKEFVVPVIDLKREFREKQIQDVYNTTDGIHPDIEGRRRIAKSIQAALSRGEYARPDPHPVDVMFEFFDLTTIAGSRDILRYYGRGKSLDAVELLADDCLLVEFSNPIFVNGFYFLYGPETGFTEMTFDKSQKVDLITFDEMSYYRRVGYRPCMKVGRVLEFYAPIRTRDLSLKAPTMLDMKSRREYIAGLSIRTNT